MTLTYQDEAGVGSNHSGASGIETGVLAYRGHKGVVRWERVPTEFAEQRSETITLRSLLRARCPLDRDVILGPPWL